MKQYKYKIEYRTPGSVLKEIKVNTYDELTRELGDLVMICWDITVYQKVKGRWEVTRVIKVNLTPDK